jgi:uncharacterized protein (DUF2461 family)
MEKSTIASNLLLKHLEKNNNREWFAENKDTYIGTKQYYYFCGLIQLMSNHDALENVSGKKISYL